jgi:[acyl-carrier-protein] S-malonyltransferase
MGQDLYERSDAARAVFDQADEQLRFALSSLCFDGPLESLTDTINQQPALFTVSIATWKTMMAQDWPAPAFMAGHSLGEFSALCAAGSITFSDGLSLVRRRGELMKTAGEREPGAMAAILALDVQTVEDICLTAVETTSRPLQLANDNCPGQVVISGDQDALVEAMRLAKESGARKVVRLPISVAAHSRLMQSAASEFSKAVDETPIQAPQLPVIGNVTAQPLTTPDDVRSELKAQLTSAVAWSDSMSYLLENDVDTVVEVGPGKVLLNLMKRIDRKTKRLKYELID